MQALPFKTKQNKITKARRALLTSPHYLW